MRLNLLIDWLKRESPDILLLQETKCIDEKFPKEEIEELGYNIAINGQKTFNGVAILSKHRLDEVITEFPNMPLPEQKRYIEAIINVEGKLIRVASIYVPNGQDLDSDKYVYKAEFLDALYNYMRKLQENEEIQVFGGDFNIAHHDNDVYNPKELAHSVLYSFEMRRSLNRFTNSGWFDLFRIKHPDTAQYSWWDYRGGSWHKNMGIRIDYLFGNAKAVDLLSSSEIDQDERGKEKPSDHVPVICEFSL